MINEFHELFFFDGFTCKTQRVFLPCRTIIFRILNYMLTLYVLNLFGEVWKYICIFIIPWPLPRKRPEHRQPLCWPRPLGIFRHQYMQVVLFKTRHEIIWHRNVSSHLHPKCILTQTSWLCAHPICQRIRHAKFLYMTTNQPVWWSTERLDLPSLTWWAVASRGDQIIQPRDDQ